MLDDFYALSLSERWLYVLLIGLGVGLVLGIFMRRESIHRKAIYGGTPAELFHYLACSTMAGLIPVIFIALFAELNFLRIVGSGIIFSLSTLGLLLIFAFFEPQAGEIEIKPVRELD